MGVQRIPVGGFTPENYQTSRDWFDPFRPYFSFPPISITKGRRTATVAAVNYKAWDRALYISTDIGANLVYEIGTAQLIAMHPTVSPATGVWDAPFRFYMTMNRSSGPIGLAAGECTQGFGIGSVGTNTPWEGTFGISDVCIHVRYNLTRQRWELFSLNTIDPAVSTPLQMQPNTDIDLRIPEFCLEWSPPYTIYVHCNGVKIHTQDMRGVFPQALPFGGASVEQIMFLTNGTNAAFTHNEAGFYCPRFFQHHEYWPIT